MRIAASNLVVGGDHVAGPMNLTLIQDLISGEVVDDRDLEVYQVDSLIYIITNGRHRYVSGLIMGKRFFNCTVRKGGVNG